MIVSSDMFASLYSSAQRVFRGKHPDLPWITYPAIQFLQKALTGRRLFEFGSGASTRWYSRHCGEVLSVENDPEWFPFVQQRLSGLSNVTLHFAPSDADVVEYIGTVGGRFGAVVVDSQPMTKVPEGLTDDFRVACLRASLPFATDDCIFIVDNTDVHPNLDAEVTRLFRGRNLHRFKGWVPGLLHPSETTIVT